MQARSKPTAKRFWPPSAEIVRHYLTPFITEERGLAEASSAAPRGLA